MRKRKKLFVGKRKLRFIGWMQWAAFHAPNFTIAERAFIVEKLEAGLTEAEKAKLTDYWPNDDVEIVRKPKPRLRPKPRQRTAGALPAPKVIEGRDV